MTSRIFPLLSITFVEVPLLSLSPLLLSYFGVNSAGDAVVKLDVKFWQRVLLENRRISDVSNLEEGHVKLFSKFVASKEPI